jgi:hypothetical protein
LPTNTLSGVLRAMSIALGFSRSVALRLFGSFTLRSLDGFEPRLLWAAPGAALRSGWRRRLRHDKQTGRFR